MEVCRSMENNAVLFIRFTVLSLSNEVSNVQSRRSELKHKGYWKPIIYQNKKNKCDLGSFMGCMRLSSHVGWEFHMALASSRANPFRIVKGIYQQSISEYLLSILGRNWLFCLKQQWSSLEFYQSRALERNLQVNRGTCTGSLHCVLPFWPTVVYFFLMNLNDSYYHKPQFIFL